MKKVKEKKNYFGVLKKKCSRRQFLKNALFTIGSAFAYFAGLKLFSPKKVMAQVNVPKELNIGIFGPSHCAAPFILAKIKEFFKAEGINLKLTQYPSMSDISNDIANGKLDFGQQVTNAPLLQYLGVAPFKTAIPVVVLAFTGVNGAALMVRRGSNITKTKDFKGKTLANHSKLTVYHMLIRMFLERYKIDFDKDINFKIVDLDKLTDAVKNGEIDSFVYSEPKNAALENSKLADVYMLSRYIWPNHPCCSLVTTREYFDKNKNISEAVTRTVIRGALLINETTTRENIIDILQSLPEYKYDKVSKPVLVKAFTPGRSDFYPFPFQSSGVLLLEEWKRYNLVPKDINTKKVVEDVFMSDFTRGIMKDLGAQPPESNYREETIMGSVRSYT